MFLYPVESSIITAIGYDVATKVAHVQFKNGSLYSYADVPATEFNKLWQAPSVGSYFIKNFKYGYKYTKLNGPTTGA